jgi:hypothetical protein
MGSPARLFQTPSEIGKLLVLDGDPEWLNLYSLCLDRLGQGVGAARLNRPEDCDCTWQE